MKISIPIPIIIPCFAVLLLAGCSSNSIPPTASADPATHGCLSEQLDACVKDLTSHIGLYQSSLSHELEAHQQYDVNRRPVAGHNLFNVQGDLLGNNRVNFFSFRLSPTDKVISAEVSLDRNPMLLFTSTPEEYDQTGLYEAAYLILGNQCPSLNREDFYRFFENKVKPHIHHGQRETTFGAASVTNAEVSKATNIPFCGKKLSFTETTGSGSEEATLDNPEGAFSTAYISFK